MVGATEERPMAYQSIEVRKLTPTIGGPYGNPYAVPSGGPRALCCRHTHSRERDHKDPGLLRPLCASLQALHVMEET